MCILSNYSTCMQTYIRMYAEVCTYACIKCVRTLGCVSLTLTNVSDLMNVCLAQLAKC